MWAEVTAKEDKEGPSGGRKGPGTAAEVALAPRLRWAFQLGPQGLTGAGTTEFVS